ncbi:hypothetical protein HDU67_000992 [Dinochytrium kinnereticum]|nr:hypothetical protein HDU67_000992 [Dinochytrium kinnereticum]
MTNLREHEFDQLRATLANLLDTSDAQSPPDTELRISSTVEGVHSKESRSLRNASLSPGLGWTSAEVEVLRKALMRFGVGNWKDITESGCLPGKTVSQLNLQTQRLLGQQSTAEFAGLHIDPIHVREHNLKREGVTRKNGFIINTGDKMSKEELKKKVEENRKRYELPVEEWNSITLPKWDAALQMIIEKRKELATLEKELNIVRQQLLKLHAP